MIILRWHIGILCLLLALACTRPLAATTVERVLLSTGNDAISLGLGNNQDDGRSFSVRAAVVGEDGWSGAIELTSHTDQQASKHRYDTLDLAFAYHLHLALARSWSLALTPGIGLKLIGSFGLEEAQSLLHSFKKKKPVILPVSTEEPAIHPGANLNVTLSYHSGDGEYSLVVATDHRHSWESEIDTALRFRYGRAVLGEVGFHLTKGWSGFPTQHMQEDRYNGFYLASAFDANLLFTSYRYYPHSGFSYGYIGFDALAFSKPKTFKKSSLTTVHGLFYEVDFNPLRLTGIGTKSFIFEVLYASGPIVDGYRHNIGRYSVSYHFEFFRENPYLRPSLQVGAGIKRFNLVKEFDQAELEMVRPTATIGVGVALGPKESWIIANTAYTLKIGAYITHVFGAQGIPVTVAAYEHHTKAWVLLLGLSLVIDHDLSGG